MYTGITQGVYEVVCCHKQPGLIDYTLQLSSSLCKGLKLGGSVAVDGVCQTVVGIEKTAVSFQAIQETLDKTTLNTLCVGRQVNIERSLRVGDEIGGHEVSGHVYGTGLIDQKIEDNHEVTFVIQCPLEWMKYIFNKGFIAVDGVSLTVGMTIPEKGLFYLHLIPETLKRTCLSRKQVNDRVNIEFDYKTKTIVDSVERLLKTSSLILNEEE